MQFYRKNLCKRKYFLKYAVWAQVILFTMNVVYIVDYNISQVYGTKADLNHIIFVVIPTFFQTLLMVMYYDAYKVSKRNVEYSKVFPFVVNSIIATNVVYFVVCVIDSKSSLYYLITSILQIVNTFFLVNYAVSDMTSFTTGVQQVILKIFIYGATIAAALSVYFCFDNPFLMWGAVVVNSVLLIISFTLYDKYLLNSRMHRK